MTPWIAETMIAVSLLMLAVLVLRRAAARAFGPRAAYLLWLAPALRMILPPLPESWIGHSAPSLTHVVTGATGASSHPLASVIATGGSAVWPMVLIGLWLGGAALFFTQHVMSYVVFTRDVRSDAQPLFDEQGIKVAASHAVISPIVLSGLIRKPRATIWC